MDLAKHAADLSFALAGPAAAQRRRSCKEMTFLLRSLPSVTTRASQVGLGPASPAPQPGRCSVSSAPARAGPGQGRAGGTAAGGGG